MQTGEEVEDPEEESGVGGGEGGGETVEEVEDPEEESGEEEVEDPEEESGVGGGEGGGGVETVEVVEDSEEESGEEEVEEAEEGSREEDVRGHGGEATSNLVPRRSSRLSSQSQGYVSLHFISFFSVLSKFVFFDCICVQHQYQGCHLCFVIMKCTLPTYPARNLAPSPL